MAHVVEIHRHPVKGFTPESLPQANLVVGQGLPMDRRFAFVSGRREEEPQPGGWVQARTFLMLCVFPELAKFECGLKDNDKTILITDPDGNQVIATVGEPDTFADADALLARHFGDGPHGRVRLVEQVPGHGHWDFSDTFISIINLATIRVISDAVGRDLEKERFRGNLYIDGLEPWEEFSWPGCRVSAGDAELEILRPIQRCAMTSTEPETGMREVDVPAALMKSFGHGFCGVYARVVGSGCVTSGHSIEITERGVLNPHDSLPERAANPALWPRFVTASSSGDGIRLRSSEPSWPLPAATAGQKIRRHAQTLEEHWHSICVLDAPLDGYICPLLGSGKNSAYLISGPYGRPS